MEKSLEAGRPLPATGEKPPAPDYSDNRVLDALELTAPQRKKGLLKALIFTAIAIFVFFCPLTIGGETDIVFGIVYSSIKNLLGVAGLWLACAIVVGNALLCLYFKLLNRKGKQSKLRDYFESDSLVHMALYLVGAAFILLYTLHTTIPGFAGPGWLVSGDIGGTVISGIVLDVMWIIPVGALFMPFLLNYGIVDFIGALMEPIMRPVFRVPGRAAVNAIASFVSSSSVGVLITNRLYQSRVYTKREAALIATGFSAVSVGFAYMVVKTAGLSHRFLPIYFVAMLVTLIVTGFMARIPPLRKKPDVYVDGTQQTKADIQAERQSVKGNIFKIGYSRAVKKAYVAPGLGGEIFSSLKDGYFVVPKVINLLTAIGILGLLVAYHTPVFEWMGYVLQPLLNLLRVPDAALIASSFPVGIAEMFLPVLLISDKIAILTEGARFMVVVVSMVQIIFFSETAVVMLACKMPIKFGELVICFFERTILAIIITAPIMHLMF